MSTDMSPGVENYISVIRQDYWLIISMRAEPLWKRLPSHGNLVS